jgi:acetyl-CoA acetyltransferase
MHAASRRITLRARNSPPRVPNAETSNQAYIVNAPHTPVGRRRDACSGVHVADLGAHVLKHLVERNAISSGDYDEVVFSCGAAVGSNAGTISSAFWLAAGLAMHLLEAVIDRVCGSSQQALSGRQRANGGANGALNRI